MKPAYYEKNHEGFEGDKFLASKISSLIEEHKINWVIETGTYRGATTRRLGDMMLHKGYVDTIEVDKENFMNAAVLLSGSPNITPFLGSSSKLMKDVLEMGDPNSNLLCYLDAHFLSECPLLDELKSISESGIKPKVIVIHDFVVPGHPELGFDEYNGQPFTWEWIKESVENIYGIDGYNKEYNSEATGAKRGVIFITPKQ